MTAPQYVSTTDGELKDVETGKTVTDPALVGTSDAPADPLAKTDGKSFIPVPMDEVKDQMAESGREVEQPSDGNQSDSGQKSENQDSDSGAAEQETEGQSSDKVESGKAESDNADSNDSDSNSANSEEQSSEGQASPSSYDDSATPTVRTVRLPNNEYGAHWGTYNGTPAFFDYKNNLFAQQAKGVIDVSEHNGNIDWAKAKAAGVEGAIIRIGYGTAALDKKALRNISECRRLRIPFGIYLYSYAYDNTFASHEATNIVNQLRKAGVSPSTLSYPVYYDLEDWTWTGHQHPTSPRVYEGIVNSWYATMRAAGYKNLAVYSYVYYLNTALNSSSIRSRTQWVGSYGARNTFPFSMNYRGWQYSAAGRINGVPGDVDLNAFGNYRKVSATPSPGATYYFKNSMSGGIADKTIVYGKASDTVLSGDWNGDRSDTLTIRRGNRYFVKNSISSGVADKVIGYGKASDTVLVGNWDARNGDSFAVRRGNTYYIKNSIESGPADRVIGYGKSGDAVLVGDWDGDGRDTLAVRRGNTFYFKNSMSGGAADTVISYGNARDTILVGDWDGDGRDTLAVRRGNTYYIKNSIKSGAADKVVGYGNASDRVLVGDWNGDRSDTLCVRR
nr:GH25 family lysozyme [Bifidobacterium catulorum]